MEHQSPEINFIKTQIAMIESECTQLRLSRETPKDILQRYERGLQHVRKFSKHYRGQGVSPTLLMDYFAKIEQLENYLQQATSQ